jgi:hypothetical protein
MPPLLVACPACEAHVKLAELVCPHCGAALRDEGGALRRTATAALLGLVAVTAGCEDKKEETKAPPPTSAKPAYGPAPTVSTRPSATTTTAASATAPANNSAMPEYGPPPSTSR